MNNNIPENGYYIGKNADYNYSKYDVNEDGILSEEEIQAANGELNIFTDNNLKESEDFQKVEHSLDDIPSNKVEDYLNEDTMSVLYAEMEAKLEQMSAELEKEESSKSGLGWLGNKISGIFGGGTVKEANKIKELRQVLSEAKASPNKIKEAYSKIMGTELTIEQLYSSNLAANTVENLQAGNYVDADGNAITQEYLNEILMQQAEDLMTQMQETVDGQGVISKAIGGINNFLDIGTTEKEAKAQIECYKELVAKLKDCKDPEKYAALYKEITGEDFNEESIEYLVAYKNLKEEYDTCTDEEQKAELKSALDTINKTNKSKAAEKIYDYTETQKSGLNAVTGVVTGIASAVLTGLAVAAMAVPPLQLAGAALFAAKYAVAGAIGAGVNVALKGIDGATSKEGYSWKQAGKDALIGALNGIVNVGANSVGNRVTSRISSKLAGVVGERAALQTTVKVGSKIVGEAVDGAIDGSLSASGEYTLDCLYGDDEFSVEKLGMVAKTGAEFGAVTGAGMSAVTQAAGAGIRGLKKVKNKLGDAFDSARKAHGQTLDLDTSGSMPQIKKPTVNRILQYLNNNQDTLQFLSNNQRLATVLDTICQDLGDDAIGYLKFLNSFDNAATRAAKTSQILKYIVEHSDMVSAKQWQDLIESLGVSPTKVAQIISNNEGMMANFNDLPELQQALKNTKSSCSFSRNMDDARKFIQESFPELEIEGIEQMSAASVGEVYRVSTPDGRTVVVKLLKEGATPEQLAFERKAVMTFVDTFTENPDALNRQITQLYDDWSGELDYKAEYQANKMLQTDNKTYRVADVTAVSSDGKALVMNMADGVQMNKLMKMLKYCEENGIEAYRSKYADMIKKYPWLDNPSKIAKELPTTLTKSFDEQLMFTKQLSDGTTGSIMHGDPHTGNFFITVNDSGELVPEFIDTGLCVTRTSQEILRDATFFTDYATGNSKGVANYFLDMCDIGDAERKAMLPELTAYIQDNIFGSGKNITEASTIISGIEAKINKMGIPLKADGATALKAEMQFFSVIKEAGSLTGQSIDVVQVIKDMPKIAGKMIRNKVNPFKLVRNIATSLASNPSQTISTAYQFKVGREEALKLMKAAMKKWNK